MQLQQLRLNSLHRRLKAMMEKKEKRLMRMRTQSNPDPEWMKKWTWKMTWRVNKKKIKKLNMALMANPFTRKNKSMKSSLKRQNFE